MSKARYSDDPDVEAILVGLAGVTTREESDALQAELARVAEASPEAIMAVYRRGEFEPFPLVWCLVGQSSTEAVRLFREALRHPDRHVRWAGAHALLESRRDDLQGPFLTALRDRSPLVKGVAVRYLKRSGDRRALPGLERLLGLKSLARHSPGIVRDVREAIERIRRREPSARR